jgi:hypothetical protein
MEFMDTTKLKFPKITRLKIVSISCILLLILVAFSGCSEDLDLRMFRSYASYDLYIQTNETITNVTFYIPLPIKEGKPIVGERILKDSDFMKNGFKTSFTQDTPRLDTGNDTYQILGENPLFVKISADKISPEQAKMFQYEINIDNSTDILNPLMFTNTIYPISNASTFVPKTGFFMPPINNMASNRTSHLSYFEVQIPHHTIIYANFTANPSATVEVTSVLRYRNEWKEYYDSWVGNSCSEYVTWDHIGEARGWYEARDTLYAARGVYPNLSSPEWQKVIEKTQ